MRGREKGLRRERYKVRGVGKELQGERRSQKKERAASIPAITTEIETLGEMKLKICDERQSEREGE